MTSDSATRAKTLADQYMLNILERASRGAIKPGRGRSEADVAAQVMIALKTWGEVCVDCRLVEQADEIIALAKEFGQREQHLQVEQPVDLNARRSRSRGKTATK